MTFFWPNPTVFCTHIMQIIVFRAQWILLDNSLLYPTIILISELLCLTAYFSLDCFSPAWAPLFPSSSLYSYFSLFSLS